ncbi:MAG: hypothetical protein PHF94_01560 [Methanothrix sp.]|jgi:hypothetical protein|nr:hypothetical protein [Methanothrix sp.]
MGQWSKDSWSDCWGPVKGSFLTETHIAALSWVDSTNYEHFFLYGTSMRDNKIYEYDNMHFYYWTDWSMLPGEHSTKFAPAAVAQNGRVYLFIIGENGDCLNYIGSIYLQKIGSCLPRYYFGIFSGQNFSENQWGSEKGFGVSQSAPSAAFFAGNIYVFITDVDGQIRYNTMDLNCRWGLSWHKVPALFKTDVAPAATVFNNKLYIFFKDKDNNHIFYSVMRDNGSWDIGKPYITTKYIGHGLKRKKTKKIIENTYCFHISAGYPGELLSGGRTDHKGMTSSSLAADCGYSLHTKEYVLYLLHRTLNNQIYYITQNINDKWGIWGNDSQWHAIWGEVDSTYINTNGQRALSICAPTAKTWYLQGRRILEVFHVRGDNKVYQSQKFAPYPNK